MARVTPDEFVEKQARRAKAAVDDMRKGVERVMIAPTSQAAAKQDKMRANVNASIDSGKWKRGLMRVSLDEWKQKMINKGLGRVATGIDEAAPKIRAFAAEILPYIDTLTNQVNKMPDTTLEDSINRMNFMIRGMAKFQRKG